MTIEIYGDDDIDSLPIPEEHHTVIIKYSDLYKLLLELKALRVEIATVNQMLDSIGAGGVGPVIITGAGNEKKLQ